LPDKAEQFSSDESSLEALNAAIAADAASEAEEQATSDARFSGTPAEATETHEEQTEQTPSGQAAEGESGLFEATPVNPDELIAQHPELAPLVRQLQGAWTKKTQSLAEERKTLEALGDIESLQQAVELSTRISDPRNWQQLHNELSGLMQEYGISPAEAHAEATRQVEAAKADEATALATLDTEDEELAPVVTALKTMQSELDSLRKEREESRQAEREEAEAARWHDALLGEITRQENTILQDNPHYTTEPGPNGEPSDMDVIYELSSFYNGDLMKAQQRFEAMKGGFISRFVEQKQSGAKSTAAHARAVGASTHTEKAEPETLAQMADEMEETLRQMQAAGEFDDSSL
jgi:hypothetical protein